MEMLHLSPHVVLSLQLNLFLDKVFATESIEHGQFICQYFGDLLSGEEGKDREAAQPSCFRYFFHYKGKQYW